MELIINRPPIGHCSSPHDAAAMIAKLPRDENFEYEVEKIIKLYGHQEKLSLLTRLYLYGKNDHSFSYSVVEEKMKSHEKIINEWDSGKWWPAKPSPKSLTF